MKNKKLIIFDFDGVIEDTFELSFNFFKEQFPELTHDEYRSWFDGNFYQVIKEKNISIDASIYYKKYEDALRKRVVTQDIEGALRALHEDFSLAIVSSSYDNALEEYLKRNNIASLFDQVWGVKKHPSKVEKFEALLEEYTLKATDCWFITDTVGDIKEANEVGIQSIAVTWGFHPRERLESTNSVFIVDTPQELVHVLKRKF